MSSNDKSTRESFGDTGIDWVAAATEMDRLLSGSYPADAGIDATTTAARVRSTDNRRAETPSSLYDDVGNGRMKGNNENSQSNHMYNNCKPQKSELTTEQISRMEENRRNALEKRRRLKSQPHSSSQSIVTRHQLLTCTQSTSTSADNPIQGSSSSDNNDRERQRARIEESQRGASETKRQQQMPGAAGDSNRIRCPSPSLYSEEQRARMEENRRRALERKNINQIQCTSSPSTYSEEQRARMEEDRRRALERKNINQIQCTSSPSTYSEEQRARMEENRRNALERKNLSQIITSPTSLVPPKPNSQVTAPSSLVSLTSSVVVNDEQRARMEENRRKALEKKHRASQLAMASSTTMPDNLKLTSPINVLRKITVDDCARMGASENQMRPLQKKTPPTADLQDCNTLDPSGPRVEKLDVESWTEGETNSAGGNQDTTLNNLEITHSYDDNKKPPAQELFATDVKSSSVLHHTKSPTKKSALPPIPPELRYDESRVLPIDDDYIDSLIENAELDETLLNGWSLFDHQKEGVRRGLKMRRLVLAFDMGLGKTIIGCVWAKAFLNTFEGMKIFVIAPVSLHDEWKRTAIDATGLKLGNDGKRSKKGKSKKKKEEDEEYERTVTGKRRKRAKKKSDSDSGEECEPSDKIDMYVFSWDCIAASKDFILDTPNYAVIADEAHYMQSMESMRTNEALTLVSHRKCRGVLLLSGTPMKNGRPSNLFPLLRAVRHPFGENQKRYEFYFCNGQQRTFGTRTTWDATGSSNLKELNAHTASHIFRMTKEECMSEELPPRKREVARIPVPSRHELRYTQALKDLAEAFSSSRTNCGGENDALLSSFQRLRQISAIAKVDAIASLSNSILVEESSIVIFTSFVAVAKEIYQKLEDMNWAGELLTGETAVKKRQIMVDRFQAGISPVFVCTYGAGGVGLTLTAACTVVLIDRPWTPGDVCQAEDRVRRIGQKRPVRSIWVRSFPIDDRIDELIDHKEVNSSAAVDGKDHGCQNRNAPKVSIADLVKSVLGNQSEKVIT